MATATASLARVHLQALHAGSRLTGWFRKGREPEVWPVTPERVLATLKKAGINCVLMGVHGINVYRDEPRAAGDVPIAPNWTWRRCGDWRTWLTPASVQKFWR